MNLLKQIHIPVFILLFCCLTNPIADITVQTKKNESAKAFADTTFHGTRYLSLYALAHIFDGSLKAVPWRQKILVEQPGHGTWTFTVDNPYVVKEGKSFNLTYPIRKGPNNIYIPVVSLLRLLDYQGIRFTYEDKESRLSIDSPGASPTIESITCTQKQNGAMVDIRLGSPMHYQPLWAPPHYIINIPGAQPASHLPLKMPCTSPAKQITLIKEDSLTQITLYIPGKTDTIESTGVSPSDQISVLIRKPFLKTKKPELNSHKNNSKTKTIIIDPGHGGKDPGAVFKKILEKNIALKVAKNLRSQLEKRGYKVLMTRDSDKTLALTDRPKFAAKHGGDLFISLHCNAIDGTPKKKKRIKGYVAYILRAGKSEEDKALARRENQAVVKTTDKKNKTEISPVEWILLEHELNLYSHQSEAFAEKIVNAFSKCKIRKHRTGAHQAGFFVLVGTFMPAVLFEMGFITNQADRQFMNTAKGQKDIAVRLAKSVDNFFKSKSN